MSSGCHGSRGDARRPGPAPRLHPDGPELAAGARRARGTLPRRRARPARPRPVRRGAGPPRSPPATPTCARSPTSRSRSPATRWAAGSRCTPRSRSAARVRRLVLVGASPGLADAAEREQRRAADDALADRIEAIGVEAFAREWAAQPLFAGHAARDRASRPTPTACATPRAGLAAALRGLGTGVMPPLWDRLGELPMPVDARRGRARREVPRDRRADGGAAAATRGSHVVAGRRPRGAPRGARRASPSCSLERRRRSTPCGRAHRAEQARAGGTAIAPAPARARRRALEQRERREPARRRRGRSRQRRRGVQPGRDAERPVERRRDVDRAARRARRRRVAQQPGDPAAARDLQADRVGRARRRPRPARPPSRPSPPAPATSARTAAQRRDAVHRLLGVLEPGRRERAEVRERLAGVAQAPLASTRIATSGPDRRAHRGDPAGVVADARP